MDTGETFTNLAEVVIRLRQLKRVDTYKDEQSAANIYFSSCNISCMKAGSEKSLLAHLDSWLKCPSHPDYILMTTYIFFFILDAAVTLATTSFVKGCPSDAFSLHWHFYQTTQNRHWNITSPPLLPANLWIIDPSHYWKWYCQIKMESRFPWRWRNSWKGWKKEVGMREGKMIWWSVWWCIH